MLGVNNDQFNIAQVSMHVDVQSCIYYYTCIIIIILSVGYYFHVFYLLGTFDHLTCVHVATLQPQLSVHCFLSRSVFLFLIMSYVQVGIICNKY